AGLGTNKSEERRPGSVAPFAVSRRRCLRVCCGLLLGARLLQAFPNPTAACVRRRDIRAGECVRPQQRAQRYVWRCRRNAPRPAFSANKLWTYVCLRSRIFATPEDVRFYCYLLKWGAKFLAKNV